MTGATGPWSLAGPLAAVTGQGNGRLPVVMTCAKMPGVRLAPGLAAQVLSAVTGPS